MKVLAFIAGAVLVLIIGGGLTVQILAGGGNSLFIQQATSPDASTLSAAA